MGEQTRVEIIENEDIYKLTPDDIREKMSTNDDDFRNTLTYFFLYSDTFNGNSVDPGCMGWIIYIICLLISPIIAYAIGWDSLSSDDMQEYLLLFYSLISCFLIIGLPHVLNKPIVKARERHRTKVSHLRAARKKQTFNSIITIHLDTLNRLEKSNILCSSETTKRKNVSLYQLPEKYQLFQELLLQKQ